MHARRAQHFFGECRRVLEGVELWSAGDLPAFGALMNQSSWSSLHNYEVRVTAHHYLVSKRHSLLCAQWAEPDAPIHTQVGSVQLATLQKLLQEAEGVYGARFSGAGTRGACVALVRADAADAVAQQASGHTRPEHSHFSESTACTAPKLAA